MSDNTEWRAEQSTGDEPLNWWVYEYQNGVFQRTVAHGLDKDTAHRIAAVNELQAKLADAVSWLEAELGRPSPGSDYRQRLDDLYAALAKSRGEK